MTKRTFKYLSRFRAGILLSSALFLTSCATSAESNSYRVHFPPKEITNNQFMNIKLMGSIALSGAKVNGLPVVEVSDLAWDHDTQTLYAISDDGYLYTMKLIINNGQLNRAQITKAVKLLGSNKQPLKGAQNDPEGLSIKNHRNGNKSDAELIVSFEGNSRVERYTTQGQYIGPIKMPSKLNQRSSYTSTNKSLESVTIHPRYGVITASELPLKKSAKNTQTLYAQNGKEWHFSRHSAKESSVTALEVLENGDILVLERAFSGIFSPLIITLRQVQLNKCDKNSRCAVKELAVFNSSKGWSVDNFEGLTKLSGDRYLMVADDNKSPIQQSIMVMFEVTP
ncbi:esterase-like activity of phytase family protein [Leucothrix sargassi]|nr:esterase-like activity of phytase family protein [Leucothrix sargassi]